MKPHNETALPKGWACRSKQANNPSLEDNSHLKQVINDIGLALNASHNTIATDDPSATPDDKSWRIDHSKEIQALKELEKNLLANSDTYP